jgi:hypothetical protein
MSKGEEMKRQNFLIFCIILFLFSGCTYYVFNRHPDLTKDVKAQESEVNKNGIILMVKCIHIKSEMKTYFDRDLVHYGILPVEIYIQNKSYPRTVALDINGINLIDLSGTKNSIMSYEQIINKMKWIQQYAGFTALEFVTLDPIGFIIGSLETSDKIKKNQSSYESHSIKFGNLISDGVTEGFTFFNIPEDLNNLNGWRISVVLKDTETENNIILDYALSGIIVPPKQRSSAVE